MSHHLVWTISMSGAHKSRPVFKCDRSVFPCMNQQKDFTESKSPIDIWVQMKDSQ